MRIIEAKDYKELSKQAANIIAAQIVMKPDCVLGLATGSSPIGTYDQLVEKYENGDLDFSKVSSVNLDEYRGLDHEESTRCLLLLYALDAPRLTASILMQRTPRADGTNPDAEAECKRYEELIRSYGGVDLQLLGLGHNGHIGFNEPAPIFEKETHCVDLTESTIEANKRFLCFRRRCAEAGVYDGDRNDHACKEDSGRSQRRG